MKRWIVAVATLLIVALFSGCCNCGSRSCAPRGCTVAAPPVVHRTCPQYFNRVSVPHPLPQRSLFTETQLPMVDCNGQCRLMGESKFRRWICEPAKPMEPMPE